MFARKPLIPILFAALITLPGIGVALAQLHLSPPLMAAVAGAAILAPSFLLLWACDAAQAEVPQSLALAVAALIAVLPEYPWTCISLGRLASSPRARPRTTRLPT